MPRRPSLPVVKIAPRVTREHGAVFVREWFPTSYGGEEVWSAFAATGLMEWPPGNRTFVPAQRRYQAIEDEILERAFAAVRPALAEAFTKAARALLARERKRGRS